MKKIAFFLLLIMSCNTKNETDLDLFFKEFKKNWSENQLDHFRKAPFNKALFEKERYMTSMIKAFKASTKDSVQNKLLTEYFANNNLPLNTQPMLYFFLGAFHCYLNEKEFDVDSLERLSYDFYDMVNNQRDIYPPLSKKDLNALIETSIMSNDTKGEDAYYSLKNYYLKSSNFSELFFTSYVKGLKDNDEMAMFNLVLIMKKEGLDTLLPEEYNLFYLKAEKMYNKKNKSWAFDERFRSELMDLEYNEKIRNNLLPISHPGYLDPLYLYH
jgi:hypothetical protein